MDSSTLSCWRDAWQYLQETLSSNYSDLCQFAPNYILGFSVGLLDAQIAYKRRFDDTPLGYETTGTIQFLMKDWMSSRSGFVGTISGSICYWIGGVSVASFRTAFLADALYFSVYSFPYNLVDSDNTVIPFFYPEFSKAPIYHEEDAAGSQDELKKTNKAYWLDRIYYPIYRAYFERQKKYNIPLGQREYLYDAKQPDLYNKSAYSVINPFNGREAIAYDTSLANRIRYTFAYIAHYHLNLSDVLNTLRDLKNIITPWISLNDWLSGEQSKKENQSLSYFLYEPFGGMEKIDEETMMIIDRYKIRRINEFQAPQKAQILISLDDFQDKDIDRLSILLSEAQNADIVFLHEWASQSLQKNAAKIIKSIQAKNDQTLCFYYDVNPSEPICEELLQALPTKDGKKYITTVGMDNPNTEESEHAHHMNLAQHQITAQNIAGTAIGLFAKEFMEDVLRFTLDKIYTEGTWKILLDPHVWWEGFKTLPKICLKVSVAPLKGALYLGTMFYFWYTKKNKSVFEIPSLNREFAAKTFLAPKKLKIVEKKTEQQPNNTADHDHQDISAKRAKHRK